MSEIKAFNNVIVVGSQWGDEGKAKVVDMLAENADVVIRSQGGCNAGHTVKFEGKTFKFHHLPSGLLYAEKWCIIGSGVVIAPEVLKQELLDIQAQGYSTQNLKISERCHVTLPYHIEQDKRQELLRTANAPASKIGTTGRGIGPTYMDKVGRLGIRAGDLLESPEVLRQQIERIVSEKGFFEQASVPYLLTVCEEYKQILAPYITDTVALLQEALSENKRLLFEGAQGTLLDVDFGTYPYVTSSNSTAGGACTGTGVGPSKIDATLGVMKAYLTRVGEGPFPTEQHGEAGAILGERGQEFGTTTGRKRRTGWFDAVVARYGVDVNGLDGIALTKLDVLDTFAEIQLATSYRHKKTGAIYHRFPASLSLLADLEPVYESMPGWQVDTTEITHFDALPEACKNYLKRLEVLCHCPIWMVSVGPERQQTMMRRDVFPSVLSV
ncbi:MAG: adenylosuccinate synthase [Vampirovibrio sp.]